MRKKSEAQARKSNGTGHANPGAYIARRAKRDCDDEALLEAMSEDSGDHRRAGDGDRQEPKRAWWSALHRLRDAGVAEKCRGTLATRCGT